ncbi:MULTISPECIES: acyltransferase [Parabacteroides]|uniref:acyltransferase n=1 Tax=Parabacteroides provencensis TaxID=1944636 RepID=UPI000C155B90|nr:acyltransferase family protein [Parabacteroides provencensis]
MLQNPLSNQSNRIVWVDVLRFIAIFMVICIHCSDPFNVSPEARSNPEFNFWGSVYGSFLRPCVPLFVMITGLLLLPVNMPIGSFYKKRLLRIAVPFLVWSVLYNLFPWVTGVLGLSPTIIPDVFAYASPDASQSFDDALKNIALIPFQFNTYTVPMWYLYMLIGLYLYMPFFSAWVEKATISQKKIFLGIWSLTLFLPYAYTFFSNELFGLCTWNTFGTFYYFAGFNGYLLLGHYLAKDVKEWSWNKTLTISLPLFIIGYIATYIGFKAMTANPSCTEQEMELFFLYCSPNVVLMTIAVFLIIRQVKFSSPRLVAIFSNITKCGLGIYLIHYFVVGLGYWIADVLSIPISLKIPVTAIIVFAICWAFVALSYKLSPKGSKWIFG